MVSFYVQFFLGDCTCKQCRIFIFRTEFVTKLFVRGARPSTIIYEKGRYLRYNLLFHLFYLSFCYITTVKRRFRDPSIQFAYEMRDG